MAFVYVYFAKNLPKYLHRNIQRNMSLFPQARHVLVSSKSLNFSDIEGLELIYVNPPDFPLESPLNSRFRGGFWLHTLNRLRILSEAHMQVGDIPMIHVEGDVLLFPNFPIHELSLQKNLAWTPLNEEADVPAIVYSPNQSLSKRFTQILEEELSFDSSHTDMSVLRSAASKLGDQHEYLPIWDAALPLGDRLPERMLTEETFSCIFDGATLGMWLTGQDPRNHGGRLLLHKQVPDHLIDPSLVSYSWDEGGWPVAVHGKHHRPICCLHIHSKNVKIFGTESSAEIRKYIELSLVTDEFAVGRKAGDVLSVFRERIDAMIALVRNFHRKHKQ